MDSQCSLLDDDDFLMVLPARRHRSRTRPLLIDRLRLPRRSAADVSEKMMQWEEAACRQSFIDGRGSLLMTLIVLKEGERDEPRSQVRESEGAAMRNIFLAKPNFRRSL